MSKSHTVALAAAIAAPFVTIAALNATIYLGDVTGGLSTLALCAGVGLWLAARPDILFRLIHG